MEATSADGTHSLPFRNTAAWLHGHLKPYSSKWLCRRVYFKEKLIGLTLFYVIFFSSFEWIRFAAIKMLFSDSGYQLSFWSETCHLAAATLCCLQAAPPPLSGSVSFLGSLLLCSKGKVGGSRTFCNWNKKACWDFGSLSKESGRRIFSLTVCAHPNTKHCLIDI